MKKRICTLLLVFCLAASLAAPVLAAEGDSLTPVESSNRNAHSYGWNWAAPIRSYLVPAGEGYLRVEKVGSGGQMVLAERYDENFQLLSQQYLPEELPIWGGFFAGENYYFAVYGQKNPNEDDSLETMRIVKYDKNWNRVGAAAYTANNTTVPFDAGAVRMAECDGMLYIRTCHEMYMSRDGLNHQANVTLAVRESDMTITDEFSRVMNIGYGYVSHSFNQFIAVSRDKTLVTLDHGDAYPRSAVLMTYTPKAGEEKFLVETLIPIDQHSYRIGMGVTYTDLLTFKGRTGDNATGAELGGLALTNEYALAAGISKDQAETATDTTKNVFLATAPLSDITKNNSLTWLTRYTAADNVQVYNPYLVEAEGGAWLLWRETARDAGGGTATTLHVRQLDANGVLVGAEAVLAGDLSGCEPIYRDGKLVWYVTDSSAPLFYTLDTDTMTLDQRIPGEPAPTTPAELEKPAEPEKPAEMTFTDVPDYFMEAVSWAVENKITNGYDAATFGSADNCNQAQILTFLWRAKGEPEPAISNPFAGLDTAQFYAKPAIWAYEQGLISGGSFDAAGVCTRGDVVTYLWRLAGSPETGAASEFSDVPAELADAVAWAAAQGITQGIGNGLFGTNQACTRGQIVTFLYRAYQ